MPTKEIRAIVAMNAPPIGGASLNSDIQHKYFEEEIMAKFGIELNREVVAEVNTGKIKEPFSIADVKKMIQRKAWNPLPTEKYVNSCLADAASNNHSHTYGKYFESVGVGKYRVCAAYKKGQ